MGEKTEIAWCDSTFNPWIGCQKVSAGCDNCYAETLMDKRYGKVEWGPHGERKRTSEANWKKPRQWARPLKPPASARACSAPSLADVFDNQVPREWRIDLFDLIGDARAGLAAADQAAGEHRHDDPGTGATVKDGPTCGLAPHARIRSLMTGDGRSSRVPATVHFISYEPAIGPLRLHNARINRIGYLRRRERSRRRMMEPAWAMDIKADCELTGTYFFMKQMTGLKPIPRI
jgi:protein gp37